MSLRIVQCRACGHQTYPARLWCPVCAEDHGRAAEVEAQEAELIAWTVMPQRETTRQIEPSPQALEPSPKALEPSGRPAGEAIIATVRVLPNGPVLVLRLEEAPARPGQRLRLFERIEQGRSLPWARALAD